MVFPTTSVMVSEALRLGWLAFQTAQEKRRLAPVPADWNDLSDDELLSLLETAERVGKPKRLIE